MIKNSGHKLQGEKHVSKTEISSGLQRQRIINVHDMMKLTKEHRKIILQSERF